MNTEQSKTEKPSIEKTSKNPTTSPFSSAADASPTASKATSKWHDSAGVVVINPTSSRTRKILVLVSVLVVILGLGASWWLTHRPGSHYNSKQAAAQSARPAPSTASASALPATALKLDTAKNYGNKYADGLLPVGDSKYSTTEAKKGTVYMCHNNFVPASQAGAQTRGPWFTNNNTQWDMNKKSHIAGDVSWEQKINVAVNDGKRVITTNDLPDHHTGVFPVASSDPARQYDANPNTISSQSLTYSLTADPSYGDPHCMGGEVGVMLSGVALFNAFDAGGRDAGAWEVQDKCDGHPQDSGEYHYHTLSRCITNAKVDQVIGYALDGFPITGPTVSENNILTTDDLDECHGLVSQYTLDGKKVTGYHYVMTQDFPYSVSCFRATATQPPGQHEHSGDGQEQTGGQPTGDGQLPPMPSMPQRPPQP
jgi:hypothetical protein